VIHRPSGIGAFQFVILASLRAVQLTRGCRPRVDGVHKNTVLAQLEVSVGKVAQEFGRALPGAAAGPAIGDAAPIESGPAIAVLT